MTAIEELASRAKVAAAELRIAPPERRAAALRFMAEKLAACRAEVLAANAADLAAAEHLTPAFRKRLLVDDQVFDYMTTRLRRRPNCPIPWGGCSRSVPCRADWRSAASPSPSA